MLYRNKRTLAVDALAGLVQVAFLLLEQGLCYGKHPRQDRRGDATLLLTAVPQHGELVAT